MYLRKCLLEIKERLGPITKELGLRHILSRGSHDDLCLFFERRDQSGILWRSPISFTFPAARLTGESEITWKRARLGLEETLIVPVGTNGWVFYERGECDTEGEPVASNGSALEVDEAFRQAADGLREQALVPQAFGLPSIVSDPCLGEFWWYLGPECVERNIAQVDVARNADGRESYLFTYMDRLVEILFRRGTVDLMVDGDLVRNLGISYDQRRVWQTLQFELDHIDDQYLRPRKV